MRVKYFIALFIFLSAISCGRSPVLTGEERKSIASEINAMLHSYYADIRKTGLEAEFTYLDSSADFYWVPPGYSRAISYDSVAAVLKQGKNAYTLIENSWDELLIHPLTKDIATYSGRIRSSITDTTGKIINLRLVESGVVVRRKDGWKLLSGQTALLP